MIRKLAASRTVFLKHKDTKAQNVLKIFVPLCLCVASVMTLVLSQPAFAVDTTALQRQGVEAYKAGNYEQALDLFSQAVTQEPTDAIALYNQGTTLNRLGRSGEAAQAFSASAQHFADHKGRAKAETNQGRALLATAGEKQDPAQKKEVLLAGSQAFQQALRDNHRSMAARQGIVDCRQELAKVNKQEKQANQNQQQQGQQDKSGEGQQDLQQQLDEAGQKQQDMAQQNKEASAGTGQEGSGQEQLQEKAAQQQSVRQSLEKIKEELNKDQNGQSEGDQEGKNLAKELEKTINEQKKAEEALNKGDLDTAQEHQQNAADNLQEMAANQASANKDNQEQSASAAVNKENQDLPATGKNQKEQDLQAAKAASTVDDILDGEKALHEMRRLRMKQQRPASGKDW